MRTIWESSLPRLPGLGRQKGPNQTRKNLPLGLLWVADFDDDEEGHNVALDLVQAGKDLAHVVLLLAVAQTLKAQRVGINGLADAQNIEHDAGSRSVIALANDDSVAYYDEEFALVI